MTDTIKTHDFVEIDYTGTLEDGKVFDTTQRAIADQNKLPHNQHRFRPAIICVGEKQVLAGLDRAIEGQEVGKEFKVTLEPQDAFGRRDVKNIEMMPMSVFKEHKMVPQPGLEFDADGRRGIITRVAGGRVIVNYNHPLAGKKVTYTCKVHRLVTDQKEQIKEFLSIVLRFAKDHLEVDVKNDVAIVTVPMQLPPQFSEAMVSKLKKVCKLKSVEFKAKSAPTQ